MLKDLLICHRAKLSVFSLGETGQAFFDLGQAVIKKKVAVGGNEPSNTTGLVSLLLENHSGDSQEGEALAPNSPSQPIYHNWLFI